MHHVTFSCPRRCAPSISVNIHAFAFYLRLRNTPLLDFNHHNKSPPTFTTQREATTMNQDLLNQMEELTFEEAEASVQKSPLDGFEERPKGRATDAPDEELDKLKQDWVIVNKDFQHGKSSSQGLISLQYPISYPLNIR